MELQKILNEFEPIYEPINVQIQDLFQINNYPVNIANNLS